MKVVLFACTHNAGRSQMAAAWFNVFADPTRARAISAGTVPAGSVHPEVVEVMREVGIDLTRAPSQRLTAEVAATSDLLVTMGCGESCPIVPGLKREDWDLEDPKGKSLLRVREIRDEIRAKVRALIKNEGLEPPSRMVLPLSHAPWREELPKKLAKIGIVDSTRIRVLRLERGYDEPGWCTRPHTLYVINGRLAIRFDDSAVPMEPGDVAVLPAGIEHHHRPEPLTDVVELLLIEPATDPQE